MWDLLRFFRRDIRQRAHALAVVTTVAIATTVAAATGSIVDRVLVRPLPFPYADRVIGVWFTSPNFPGGLSRVRQSKATYLHLREEVSSFEHFALAEDTSVTIDTDGEVTRVPASWVTADLFAVLGVEPAMGRALVEGDSAPGAPPVVVLTDRSWRDRFGADTEIIGRHLRLDGVSRQVIAVLPPRVSFPGVDSALWLPLTLDPARLGGQDFVYTGYGLRKPDTTAERVATDLQRAIERLPDAYPETFPRPLIARLQLSSLLVPLTDELVGSVRQPLLVVMAAAAAVLLAVFANLTNLFLLRQARRAHELAIRAALGASTARLRAMVAWEGAILGGVGAVLGLGASGLALEWVRQAASSWLPRSNEIVLSPAVSLLCGLLAVSVGVAAALTTSTADRIGGAPDRAATRTASRPGSTFQWALVAGQVALAVVAATGAGLLLRSAQAVSAIDPGFSADRVAGARLFLPPSDYADPGRVDQFFRDVLDRIRADAGVERASVVSFLPLRDGRILYPYRFENDPREDALPTPRQTKLVFEGYFETLGIPVKAGRPIERQDLDSRADVVVVNQAFADAHWPGTEAIGRRIRFDTAGPWLAVVGVVGNERDRSLTDPPPPIVYLPYQARHAIDSRLRELSVVARGRVLGGALPTIAAAVAARDRSVPVTRLEPLADTVAAAGARLRYAARLTAFCAVASLILVAIGLHAVLSNAVTTRLQEIAIRMSLGASDTALRTLLLRRVGLSVIAGGITGAVLAAWSGRLLTSWLVGVAPTDPATIAGVGLLIGIACWGATVAPSRRALRQSPAVLLRSTSND